MATAILLMDTKLLVGMGMIVDVAVPSILMASEASGIKSPTDSVRSES